MSNWNHVLRGAQIPIGMENFEGEEWRVVKCMDAVVSCAQTALPMEMPFWTSVGPTKHVLGGVHSGATWRIQMNRACAAAVWPVPRVRAFWLLLRSMNSRSTNYHNTSSWHIMRLCDTGQWNRWTLSDHIR